MFYNSIDYLHLPISLWMKGRREFQLGSHLVPQCLAEIANELNIPIWHHDFAQPMQFDDIINEKDSYPGCI